MKQKLLAVLLSLIMVLCLSVPAFAATKSSTAVATTAAATTAAPTTTAKAGETTEPSEEDNENGDVEEAQDPDTEGSDGEEKEKRIVDEIITSYNNNNGRVMSVAKMGYPRLYPEDSLPGLHYCIENGVDIIAVKVQQTKDKGLVLLEDSKMGRMLVNRATGKAADGKVSDYTLEQIQNDFYLRDGHGGRGRKVTKQTVPGLHDALELTRNSAMLYITNGFQYAETINDVAKGLNACDVVILGGATSADDIKIFVDHTGTPICHITSNFVDGETEGSPRNFVRDTLKAGADAVNLASSKDYSSIFKSATTKRFEETGRAMISATTFATSGEHVDRIEGWQELIEDGYSILETDYPKELATYIKEIEAYRTELTSLITQAQALNPTKYSKETAKTLKKSLEAAETVSADGSISLRQIDEARYNLQESIDALELGTEVDQAHTPIWQIALIVLIILLAVTGLIIVLLRLFNKHKKDRRKQRKVRKKYQAMSERNLATAETEINDSMPTISQDSAGSNIYESFTGETLERPAPTADDEKTSDTGAVNPDAADMTFHPDAGKPQGSTAPSGITARTASTGSDDSNGLNGAATNDADPGLSMDDFSSDDFKQMLKDLEDSRKN